MCGVSPEHLAKGLAASNSDFHSGPANRVTAAAARADERVGIWACAEPGQGLSANEQQDRLRRRLSMLNSDTVTRTKWFEITWLSSGWVTNTSSLGAPSILLS